MSDPLWYTAAEAERHLGIPASTVRSWARRRQIVARGLDEEGSPLYAVSDLRTLNRKRARRNNVRPDQEKRVA
jgi:DNA-binding transcriptional MerR regulator